MTDLLVKLYQLPPIPSSSFLVRPALAPERHRVLAWVREHFTEGWASEVEMTFGGHPIGCFLATDPSQGILGFACINATFQGFFGPVGVHPDQRGQGIGTALLITALHALHGQGFAYAVIGATKAPDYYRDAVGAIPIPDSWPGAYAQMLPPDSP